MQSNSRACLAIALSMALMVGIAWVPMTAHAARTGDAQADHEAAGPAAPAASTSEYRILYASKSAKDKIRTWGLENDAWGRLFHPTDRDYTMGVPVSESMTGLPDGDVWRGLLIASRFISSGTRVDDKPIPDWSNVSTHWMWGNSTFTPKDLRTSAPIPIDRPYASLLYAGAGYTRGDAFEEPLPSLTSEFQVGILGTRVSRWVQTTIHRQCCPNDLPQGWDNQIGDGGSLTFLYGQTRGTGILKNTLNLAHFDPILVAYSADVGYDVGYHVDLRASATFGIGATPQDLRLAMASAAPIAVDAPNYFEDQSMAADRSAIDLSRLQREVARRKGIGLYARIGVRFSAYDELMQGAWTGRNNVTIPRSRTEHMLGDATVGFDLSWLTPIACHIWRFAIHLETCSTEMASPNVHYYLVQSWRTRDIRGGPEGSHYWGGVRFSYDID